MKGFPNQVSDLQTLTKALIVLRDLIVKGKNPRDDGVYGEALVRSRVLGTGHIGAPIDDYLARQKAIPKKSNQSYRTRARGLRELFGILGLVADSPGEVSLTATGLRIASLGSPPGGRTADAASEGQLSETQLRAWRTVILDMTHDGGDVEASHPYQVLLRLIARCPGISRAKCSLALEAKNDSDTELERIVRIAGLSEPEIIRRIGTTRSNWDNGKKILPRFAEQLGDVRKVDGAFFLGDSPGAPEAAGTAEITGRTPPGVRSPRASSRVTARTIARAATAENWDEAVDVIEPTPDPLAQQRRREKTMRRLNRHNLIVQRIARLLEGDGAELFENPFDCLACFPDEGLLVEVKTLDGSDPDEIARVRDSLAQLLYYESFVTRPLVKKRALRKVACFEKKINDAHIEWLAASDILVIWTVGEAFDGTTNAKAELSGHFGF